MNKDFILFNLKEALEELTRTINDIENDPEYSEYGDYDIAMQHLYHHINTAWNAKDATNEQVNVSDEKEFYRWRQFPHDINMK